MPINIHPRSAAARAYRQSLLDQYGNPPPQPMIIFVSVTKEPHRMLQALNLAKSHGVPTIEILKDGVREDLQVRREHLSLARKMAGLK